MGKDMGKVGGRVGRLISQFWVAGLVLFGLGFIWGAKYQDTKHIERGVEQRQLEFESSSLHRGDLVVHRLDEKRHGVVTKMDKGGFVVRLIFTDMAGR